VEKVHRLRHRHAQLECFSALHHGRARADTLTRAQAHDAQIRWIIL
jgi:hypothetical protein